jgi:hypothetical protein
VPAPLAVGDAADQLRGFSGTFIGRRAL